jgi:hypothetical protein
MNKTQTTEQTNTQHLKPITRNDLAQNTGYRKTRHVSINTNKIKVGG